MASLFVDLFDTCVRNHTAPFAALLLMNRLAYYIGSLDQNDPAVTAVHLFGDAIGDDGAAAIAGRLENNMVVTKLFLNDNGIEENGAMAIAQALRSNRVLTGLYLGEGNSIGDYGAVDIAGSLQANPVSALTELDLDENSIGDIGAQGIAQLLKQNGPLRELFLSGNSIGDVGAQAIGEALATNTVLAALTLRDNSITDMGAQYIAQGLEGNKTLMRLELMPGNQIGDAGEQAFRALQMRRPRELRIRILNI